MTPAHSTFAREAPAGNHLPYARHVDETTIELRNGNLMQTLRLDGLLFETADTDELNYRSELRDALLRSVGSSRFAIYHHVIRRRAETALDARFPDEFSRALDAAWRERLAGKQMYVNDLFLTIVHRPASGKVGLFDRLRSATSAAVTARTARRAAERRALQAVTDTLKATLGAYGPRQLGIYSDGDLLGSELLEFLSYLCTSKNPLAKAVLT